MKLVLLNYVVVRKNIFQVTHVERHRIMNSRFYRVQARMII